MRAHVAVGERSLVWLGAGAGSWLVARGWGQVPGSRRQCVTELGETVGAKLAGQVSRLVATRTDWTDTTRDADVDSLRVRSSGKRYVVCWCVPHVTAYTRFRPYTRTVRRYAWKCAFEST